MRKNRLFAIILSLVFVCCLFAGCSQSPAKYEITVKSFGAGLGSVEGGNATYTAGDNVTIKAVPVTSSSSSGEFFCWLLNNKVASTEAEYTFVVSDKTAGDYVALFVCPYIEYFALSEIDFDSGIDADVNSTTSITKLEIHFGSIENLTQLAYSFESDTFENKFVLTSTEIYENDKMPYAYNIQQDIFVKIVVTYIQDEVEFVSTTKAKILGNDDVTIDLVELKNEEESTTEETKGISLNQAVNLENDDLRINIANTPTISLKLARLSTFDFTENDTNED